MKKIITILLMLTICPVKAISGVPDSVWKVMAVYDGDTIVMAKQDTPAVKIRLADIDAPEHDQPYGPEAKALLKKLLEGCDVHFMPVDIDHYGRNVAVVTACGKNVNAAMVEAGAAWVYTQYNTDDSLPPLEDAARAGKRGIWAKANPTAPDEWRHNQKKRRK